MRILRRLVLSTLVWLTAATTLVAGLPQLHCVCPDGRIKAYCLSALVKTEGGCCCNGGCCTAGEACPMSPPEEATPSCCGAAEPAGDGLAFNSSCCSRTVAEPDTRVAGDPPARPAKDTAGQGWLMPAAAGPVSISHAVSLHQAGSIHLAAPPPDRVVVFQHFLI